MGTLTKFIIIRLQPRRRNSGFDRRSADGRITPARWAAQCELVGVLRAADTQFPASCVPARSRARPDAENQKINSFEEAMKQILRRGIWTSLLLTPPSSRPEDALEDGYD
ncbi:uncharacterized protein LOC134536980 isoform X2 [Bacillus rossius redtenbacheri]|uniref:uncharacterized protein LOC134536980 isoform X2 n=1 Tax=Bacillus rossius redtenbacheri TaxID=93214 RepID=UPI002FDEC187